MQVFLELSAQCRHHARRSVADVETADSAGKIEIAIAVHVLERSTFRGSHENGRAVVWAAGNRGLPPGHQGPRARSGNFRANLYRRHFSTTQSECLRGSRAPPCVGHTQKRKMQPIPQKRRSDRDDKQQDEVPASQNTPQVRFFFFCRRARRNDFFGQLCSPSGRVHPSARAKFAQCPAELAAAAPRSDCALASPGATSSNAVRCLSMSASVCCAEIVHCSSHE